MRFHAMYGLTERPLYVPPEEVDRWPGSVSIAIPGTDAWVEDDNGHGLGPGAVGKLVVRAAHVV